LTTPDLGWRRHGRRSADMLDVLMIALTVVFFAAAFALVAWLERV
jgi:preprotein translocase subunit SecG